MQRGFTLIETIVYIGLFTLIMGAVLPAVYQIFQSDAQLSTRTTLQEEENFVMRKIDWALSGAQSISSPSSATPLSDTLSLERYDGSHVDIRQNGTQIEMRESSAGAYVPITTGNVVVNGLSFTYIVPSGSGPMGIAASSTISGFTASSTKYIRQ